MHRPSSRTWSAILSRVRRGLLFCSLRDLVRGIFEALPPQSVRRAPRRHRRVGFEACEGRVMLAAVSVSFEQPSYVEGQTALAIFTVAGGPAKAPFSITYDLTGGPGGPSSPTLHFSKGAKRAIIEIPTTDDSISNNGYTLKIQITSNASEDGPAGPSGPYDSAQTEILDNDGSTVFSGSSGPSGPGTPTVWLTGSSYIVENSTLANAFTFSRSHTEGSLTVAFTVSGGTASGSDWNSSILSSGLVNFFPTEPTVAVPVEAVEDALLENFETLIVTITPNPSSYNIATGTAGTELHDGEHGVVDTGFAVEFEEEEDVCRPEAEVLWDEFNHRWIPNIPSAVIEDVAAVAWYHRPYNSPSVPWLEFAGRTFSPWTEPTPPTNDDFAIEANLGHGNYDVMFVVNYGLLSWFQAVADQRVVVTIASVEFKQHQYTDGLNDFTVNGNTFPSGHGGDLVFAEKQAPGEAAILHDTVDVEVTIAWGGGPRPATNVFLKVFDPDHDSDDIDFDTNGDDPEDNVKNGGFYGSPGATLNSFNRATLPFDPMETTERIPLIIHFRRPGNNFIVASSALNVRLLMIEFKDDGITLFDPVATADVPASRRTHILTVWRTLNVEEDSMRAPIDDVEVFDGAGVGNDDVHPGNPGTNGGAGDFVQPSLSLLAAEFAKAHVAVAPIPAALDTSDDIAFHHNLEEDFVDHGNLIRDVPTEADFWTIQVLAAYEGPDVKDFDGEVEAIGGNTSMLEKSPINIYLETLRDVSANLPNAVAAELLRQRAVLHETMHKFGHAAHDVAIMKYDLFWFAPTTQIELVGVLEAIRKVMLA